MRIGPKILDSWTEKIGPKHLAWPSPGDSLSVKFLLDVKESQTYVHFGKFFNYKFKLHNFVLLFKLMLVFVEKKDSFTITDCERVHRLNLELHDKKSAQ